MDNDVEYMLTRFKEQSYEMDEDFKALKLTKSRVFLPENIYELFDSIKTEGQGCEIHVWEMDTLSASKKLSDQGFAVCALVYGHPSKPGGSIRRLKNPLVGQEESIAFNTSLLLSQESKNAQPYYERQTKSGCVASDAVLYSPYVAILDQDKQKITHKISCITAVAPMCSFNKKSDGFTEDQFEKLWLRRWLSILAVLNSVNCRTIVLGAFGCGCFLNPPDVTFRMLKQALDMFGNRFQRAIIAIPAGENLNVARMVFEEK